MSLTEKVMKTTWILALIACTTWLIIKLYIPALSYMNAGFDLATVLYLLTITFGFIFVWAIAGYATSIVASVLGFILGGMVEAVSYLYVRYKPRV